MITPFIEALERGLQPASEDQIERMLAQLVLLYPAAKLSDGEAAMRVELYIELLADLPNDCLAQGFREVAKASRFFPSVSEIRDAAMRLVDERKAMIFALKKLRMKSFADVPLGEVYEGGERAQ